MWSRGNTNNPYLIMTEEYKYEPYPKMTLQTKAIKITRAMLKELAHVRDAQSRDLSASECMDVVNDYIAEFQYYLGSTCGDKATHWFSFPYDEHLLEAHKDPKADDKLDDALIMGNDAILEGECGLYKWVNNLIAYGESCYGDPQYLAHTFDPCTIPYEKRQMRLLMEERLGLEAERVPDWASWADKDNQGWVYKAIDPRGLEYGAWWFSLDAENEEVEATKWFGGSGSGGKAFIVVIPFGDFYTFYKEMVG